MNRRQLLKTCLAAGVTGFAATSPAADAPRRVKIGFLGCSHSHGLPKVQLALASPDWECTGVFEAGEKARAQAVTAGAKAMSQSEVLAASEVIAVESDARDRFRLARAALAAGKHLHLEKPPTVTLEEFRELQALARQHGKLMQMGYMWRFNPGLNTALEAARRGWLGEVYLVRGSINTNISGESRQSFAEISGGTMYELGCHLIDPLIRLMGRHVKVTPVLRHDTALADGLADNTVAVFDFPRAVGIISSAIMQPTSGAHRTFEIQGTNGMATVKPLEQPVLQIDLARAAGPYRQGSQTLTFPPYKRYVPEFAELAECVRGHRPLAVTPEEDLHVQEALLRACAM